MTEEKNTQINTLSQTESHLSATRQSNSTYKTKGSIQRKIHFMPFSQSQLARRTLTAEGRYHTFSMR